MAAFESHFPACVDHGRKRQHSRIQSLSVTGECGKGGKFLAACRQKHAAFRIFQIFHRRLRIAHINSLLTSASGPEHSYIITACFLTGVPDIFRHLRSVGMCGVENKLRFLTEKESFHLLFCQTFPLQLQILIFFQRFCSVFCGGTAQNRNPVFRKETADLVSFRGSGKYNRSIHYGILWV